jgi:hypothetical protein
MGCSVRTVQRLEGRALHKLRLALEAAAERDAVRLEQYLRRREAFTAYLACLMASRPGHTDRLPEPPPCPW